MSKILNKELLSEIVETGKKVSKKNEESVREQESKANEDKNDDRMWLIYIDDKVSNYERTENLAKRAMIKILETKLKEFTDACYKCLITHHREDKRCIIYSQSLGNWFNGSTEKVLEVSIEPVNLFRETALVVSPKK